MESVKSSSDGVLVPLQHASFQIAMLLPVLETVASICSSRFMMRWWNRPSDRNRLKRRRLVDSRTLGLMLLHVVEFSNTPIFVGYLHTPNAIPLQCCRGMFELRARCVLCEVR